MVEARKILNDGCKVPDVTDNLISIQRINDLTDLYQLNHLWHLLIIPCLYILYI